MIRVAALALAFVVGGCATTGSRAQLIDVARTTLNCPVEQMEVAMISSQTHWVRGCDQVATFTLDCAVDTCTWRLQGKPVKRR
jgi:hypothetical protein